MKINVTRSSMPSFEEYCEEIKDIWESRWLTNHGVKLQELEEKLKKYVHKRPFSVRGRYFVFLFP